MNDSQVDTRSVNRWMAVVQLVLVLTAALCASAYGRAKTDKIVMRNGDNLSVEIKELSLGKLKVKTDDMGTIDIEWDKIAALHSDYHFRVTASGGDVYNGALDMAGDSTRVLRVIMLEMVTGISQESVVSILPIARTFFARVDGSLSLGFTFTKASEVSQLAFNWSNIYRGEVNVVDFNLNTLTTDKHAEEERTDRVDAELGLNHLLGRKKWLGTATAGYQRNDELDLRNRYIGTAGMGMNMVRSNHNLLRSSLSLAWNVEQTTDSSGTQQSLEADLAVNYQVFRYDSPKTDVATRIDFYPSLTEKGRYRIEFDARAKHEVLSDFFLEFRYYTSVDNRSPATGGWKSDYGFSLGMGWTY